jgi:hypothetical protein
MIAAMLVMSGPVSAAATKAKAQISNAGPGLKAQAEYQQKTKKGVTHQKLSIQVKNAFPLQTLLVAVNGETIGSIQTNAFGRGKLKLKTPQNAIPLIGSGSVLTIGEHSATFFTKADKYHVKGHLSQDGTTVSGVVKYHQKPRKGELDRRFWVNLDGAFAGEVFDVWVGGLHVGTITADVEGEGSLKLRTAAFANGAWQPMPHEFPALVAGDVVTVGAMSITLD